MQQTTTATKSRTLKLVISAMMIALIFIFSRFLGINADIIHIGFDFLPVLVIACFYGPAWAAVVYMIGDLVCAIGMPIGMINPGITVVAGLIGLTYGLVFYSRDSEGNLQIPEGKSMIIRTVVASLIVAGILKLFATTTCLAFAYGSPYWPMLISRIPNCAIMLAAQIITIPLIIRYVIIPVRNRLGL